MLWAFNLRVLPRSHSQTRLNHAYSLTGRKSLECAFPSPQPQEAYQTPCDLWRIARRETILSHLPSLSHNKGCPPGAPDRLMHDLVLGLLRSLSSPRGHGNAQRDHKVEKRLTQCTINDNRRLRTRGSHCRIKTRLFPVPAHIVRQQRRRQLQAVQRARGTMRKMNSALPR